MRFFILIAFALSLNGVFAQKVSVLSFDKFEQRLKPKTDTLYIVNYWATWCKPCVEELPDFLQIESENSNRKLKLILVTLDFTDHLDSRVIPFLKAKGINSEVILLDESNPNNWIDKVNKNWDGSIPVTKFIYKNQKKFIDHALNYSELSSIIKTFNY